ncbi:MAG: glycerol-3-phosphate dehydrogenase/oxidase [Thermoplasmataceae archaeon]
MKNPEFSSRTRAADLETLEDSEFDVLVIGGGINGAGVANTLAQIGIKTLLVEANDFASGTSSASSKLIHGGLRYLQQGRIREVRNLIRERDYLRRNTRIVRDIDFHILITPNSWHKWEIRLGLMIYNILGHRISFPVFHRNSGEYPSAVRGYFSYTDAITDDSRLVISNICSAHNHGAVCLNYVRFTAVERTSSGFSSVVADSLTGKEYRVHARAVVNCTGPWAAEAMKLMGTGSVPGIKLSRGIHIVLPAGMFNLKNAIAFRSHIDGRQIFILPRGEVVHIGTTDNFVRSPEERDASREEISYLLESTSYIFGKIDMASIITTFSGIRPLVSDSSDPGKATREFSIFEDSGIIHVLGGKLTDYRIASRKVAGLVTEHLGLSASMKGLPVIDYTREDEGDPIQYDIEHECAITVDDIVRRREGSAIYSSDAGLSMRMEAERHMAKRGVENQG